MSTAASSARAILLVGLLSQPAGSAKEVFIDEEPLAIAVRFFPAVVVLNRDRRDETLHLVISLENRSEAPLVVLRVAGKLVLPDGGNDTIKLGGPYVINSGARIEIEGPVCVPRDTSEGTGSVSVGAVFRPAGPEAGPASRLSAVGYFQVLRR